MAGQVIQFGHTGLCVSDLETSIHFYKWLGFRHEWTTDLEGPEAARLLGLSRAKMKLAHLTMGPNALELFQFTEPSGRDMAKTMRPCDRAITHIGLTVIGLDDLFRTFQEHGYETFSEPMTLPSGARAVFVRDPDGIPLELIEQARG